MRRALPLWIVGMCLVYLTVAAAPPDQPRGGLDVRAFGRLPVQMNGRVQPIDSVARVALLQIRDSTVVPRKPADMQPSEWLLELLARPDVADSRKIFRVAQPGVPSALGLAPLSASDPCLSFEELRPKLKEISGHAARILKVRRGDRSAWEQELLALRSALLTYQRLKNSIQPNSELQRSGVDAGRYDFAARVREFQGDLRSVAVAGGPGQRKAERVDNERQARIRGFAAPHAAIARGGPIPLVPPPGGAGAWRSVSGAVLEGTRTGRLADPVSQYAAMTTAAARGDVVEFNRTVARYEEWLRDNALGADLGRVQWEAFLGAFQPLVRSVALYVLALVLTLFAWWKRSPMALRSAAGVSALGVALHGISLVAEMSMDRRMPPGSLYDVVLTVGCGAALLGVTIALLRTSLVLLAAGSLAGIAAIAAAQVLARGDIIALSKALMQDAAFQWTSGAAVLLMFLGTTRLFPKTDQGTTPPVSAIAAPRRKDLSFASVLRLFSTH